MQTFQKIDPLVMTSVWDIMEKKQRLLQTFYSLGYHCSPCFGQDILVDPTEEIGSLDRFLALWFELYLL